MTSVNTHGYKMTGIKAAAHETKCIRINSGNRVQISYDTESGKVYAEYLVGSNNWITYNDDSIKHLGFADRPMTMQEIADMITDALGIA